MAGKLSNAVTQQRNAQLHVLQNFAAGFRSQARTPTGSASIVGVLHSAVDLGLYHSDWSEQNAEAARRTSVIVPAGRNPTLLVVSGCVDFPKRVEVQIEEVLSIASLSFVQEAQISVTGLVPLEGAPGPQRFDGEHRRFTRGVLFAESRLEVVLKLLAFDERELGGVEIPFVVV